ncbi:MAG: hypothetical protein LIO95_09920, partial [Clostridiales bacterium]|nr:hypothetical protein [Clostridiales bacterium]
MTETFRAVLELNASSFISSAKSATENTKKLGTAVGQVDDNSGLPALTSQAKTAATAIKTVVTSIAAITGITMGVQAVLNFASSCATLGGEAQAMNAQFSQVFGSLADEAAADLEAIADSAGMTVYALKSDYTSIASFAKAAGMSTADSLSLSNRAIEAAADVAAFYDRSLEDVTENLRSFLKGNYENDAALGVSCTETTRNTAANKLYGKSFAELSEEQKQLTLLQMVEDANELSGAMGQAAREADSWANQTQLLNEQWSEFKSIIGTGLVTVLKPVVSFMNTLLAGMIRLANTVGTVLSNLFGIEWEDMTASDSISDTTDSATDSTDDLTDSTSDAADATDDLADATDDLTDATEDAAAAQKSLMGFDEITKLTAATSSSSSSGSGSGSSGSSSGSSGGDSTDSGSDLGDTSSLVDQASESLLDKSESALSDWADRIGEILTGLGDWISDMLDSIFPDDFSIDINLGTKNAEKQIENLKQTIDDSLSNLTYDYSLNIDTVNLQTLISQTLNDIDVTNIVVNVSLEQDGWDTVSDYIADHGGGGFGGGGTSSSSGFGGGGGHSFSDGWTLPIWIQLMRNNWESLEEWVTGGNAITAFVRLAKDDWDDLSTWAGDAVLNAKVKLSNSASDVWSSFKSSWNNLNSTAVTISNSLKSSASSLWNTFKSNWGSRAVSIANSLKTSASSLWSAFKSKWGTRSVSITNSLK